jgi:hypothetical protein
VAADDRPSKVNFDYIKGNFFRVIHVDGAIGGLTPQRLLHAALYSERPSIPQRLVHRVNPDGSLGDRLDEESLTRGSVVRELEADLIMSIGTAESLANWLLDKVREYHSLTKGDTNASARENKQKRN